MLINGGLFYQQFEQVLCEYFGVLYLLLFVNGIFVFVIVLQVLCIIGEVIMILYLFVVIVYLLLWNGIKFVFVDVVFGILNFDVVCIEVVIMLQIIVIMFVYCYGNLCDVDVIQKIVDNYNLCVIYDVVYVFGVQIVVGSVFVYGDLLVLSFYVMKVFNMFEGGVIVCFDVKIKQWIDYLKNFGFVDEVMVVVFGINGKMSEINVVFGMLQLQYIDGVFVCCCDIDMLYCVLLFDVCGICCLLQGGQIVVNYVYFLIFVEDDYLFDCDVFYCKLCDYDVYVCCYFYLLIFEFFMYCGLLFVNCDNLFVVLEVVCKVLCLLFYLVFIDDMVYCIVKLIGC